MYITLEETKRHLNILDDFFNEDDDYIRELIRVCEDAVAKRINKDLAHCIDHTGALEPSVKHSILLLVGTYYNQREATSPSAIKEVPYTLEYLANLNKRYSTF